MSDKATMHPAANIERCPFDTELNMISELSSQIANKLGGVLRPRTEDQLPEAQGEEEAPALNQLRSIRVTLNDINDRLVIW